MDWQILDNHAAQIVLLLILMAWMAWLSRVVLQHSERITVLSVLVTNEYKHRFEQIKDLLGIEKWDDEQKS